MRWRFSRLNTCCAHKNHWMCGYAKQVSWFVTVICHLHWMVLITTRTNSSFITTSSTAIAVAIFLSLLFFFQLVSGDINCQLTGQNPQVTLFMLTCTDQRPEAGGAAAPGWELSLLHPGSRAASRTSLQRRLYNAAVLLSPKCLLLLLPGWELSRDRSVTFHGTMSLCNYSFIKKLKGLRSGWHVKKVEAEKNYCVMRVVCSEVLQGLVLALKIFQCQSGPRM